MNQKEALDVLKMGHNVFLTGPAGSGKTFLLNKYIEYLKDEDIAVGITASTGIASTHLGGRTIHSWAGFGIQDEISTKHMMRLLRSPLFANRVRSTKVLVIDEISMLHDYQLDLANQICKKIRHDPAPFGGMQVVLSGDFFQLPPVSREREEVYFVNSSNAWSEMGINVCYLGKCQYRQKDDNFIKLLNEIRKSDVSPINKEMLFARTREVDEGSINPVKLRTHNKDVDAINSFELQKIKSKEKIFQMTSWGPEKLVKLLKKGCLAPEELILKKKAVVMFVKNNFGKGYINGTLGKVIGFNGDGYPIVKTISGSKITAYPESWEIEEDDEVLARISQVPLRLAWAMTVHKSQGMTLDKAEVDLSKTFDYGMGYVALSRVRSFSGIKLIGINDLALKVSDRAIRLDGELRELSKKTKSDLEKLGKDKKKKLQEEFVSRNTDKDKHDITEDEEDIDKIPF